MITSWTSCTIQDLQNKGEAELKTGPFGTQLHASDYVETGTPVINVRNIGFGEIREEKLEFIAEETVQRLSSHLLEPGDIVFGRKGAVERHAFINPKYARWFQGSDCLRLRVKSPSVDSRFLSYYFLTEHHKQWMINQCSHGATMASLNQAIISRIPLLLPSIHTQRKIISILSAYDDLIENNTRRIEILEEMARSLYREWFVNFRFPGHEQVKMVDSELGLIPEGWKLKKLDELGSIGRGKSKHRPRNDPSLYGGDYPFVQTGEVKEASLYITHYSQTYNEKGLAQSKLWEPQTLLLTIAANIAETAILTIPACFPDSIVGFVANFEQVTPEFIKFRIDDIKEKMQSFSRGTAQDNLSLDKIKLFDFLVPDKDCIRLFEKYTAPLFSQVQNLLLKNAKLRQTRNLLLPRLISGEISGEIDL